jgi:hypothetical protein
MEMAGREWRGSGIVKTVEMTFVENRGERSHGSGKRDGGVWMI